MSTCGACARFITANEACLAFLARGGCVEGCDGLCMLKEYAPRPVSSKAVACLEFLDRAALIS